MPEDPVDAEVTRLLIAHQKIEAIKVVRAKKDLGLKEAKEYVEAIADRMPPGMIPPRKPIGLVGWLVVLALLMFGWWLYRSL